MPAICRRWQRKFEDPYRCQASETSSRCRTPPSGPTMMARVVKALKRHAVTVFNPERIPIGGKRKLKDAPCRTTLSLRVVRLPTRIRNAVKIRRTENYRRSPRNHR
jgi:hypothetical protein